VPPALTFRLRFPAIEDFQKTYPLGSLWNLTLSAKARFDEGLDAAVAPPLELTLHPPSGTVSMDVRGDLLAQRPKDPIVLLGKSGGSRLDAQTLTFGVGFQAQWDAGAGVARGEPTITGSVEGGTLMIDLSEADNFIALIAGGGRLQANLDFKLLWSPKSGF